MKGAKTAAIPMSTTTKLTKDEQGKGVEEKLYRGMIGSLLYLTASRPDIILVFLYMHVFNHVQKFSSKCCKKYFQISQWL